MPPVRRAGTLVDALSEELLALTFDARALAEGEAAVRARRVARPRLGQTRALAAVADGGRVVRTRIAFIDGRLHTWCSCGRARCAHAAALALLLLGLEPGAEPEVEPGAEPEVEPGGEPRSAASDLQAEPGPEPWPAAGPARWPAADPEPWPAAGARWPGAAGGPDGAGDEEARRSAERALRRERGGSPLFLVTRPPGPDVHGEYQVLSPTARTYRVALRAVAAPHNGCTCPDRALNELGTCKHVEAVLAHLRARTPRRLRAAREHGPSRSYLHLLDPPEQGIGLCLARGAGPRVLRLADRFDAGGRLRAALLEAWPAVEAEARAARVEVPEEVARHAERILALPREEARGLERAAEARAAGPRPPGLLLPLHPFQVEGAAFLVRRGRALLADEMGLGKTAQAIAALLHLARRGEVERTVVVCPTSLKQPWAQELQRFAGLGPGAVAVVDGGAAGRRALYARPPPVLITSYELVRLDARLLEDVPFDLLVVDEAQRIRNWRTATAAAVKGIRSRFTFVLTGTPVENRLEDLYSVMQAVDPALLGPLWRFEERFTLRHAGVRRLDELRARLGAVMLRRRKAEVLPELPGKRVRTEYVPMSIEQRAAHGAAEQAMAVLFARARREGRRLTPREELRVLRLLQAMRMACDASFLVGGRERGAPKLDALARHLEAACLRDGEKVVVFSEWERMQAAAAEVCQELGMGHVRLHGGVPSRLRGRLLDRFRGDPACQVFLATDAGGVGLNLQVARRVVNLDLPWNPAVLEQRLGRVHRIGQCGPVEAVLLVSELSMECRVAWGLQEKQAAFEAVVGDDTATKELACSSVVRRLARLLDAEFAGGTGIPAAPRSPGDGRAAPRPGA